MARLRQAALEDAVTLQGVYAEYAGYAAGKAAEALGELEQAADFSRLLRELDPENAENYPDPEPVGPAVHPLVAALRSLADQYAALPMPQEYRTARIEVTFHGVGASVGRVLAEEYAGDTKVTEKITPSSWWLNVDVKQDGDLYTELTVFVDPDREPEPFVQATPAEVAEAYESSAAYAAALTAEPRPAGWLLPAVEVHHTAVNAADAA